MRVRPAALEAASAVARPIVGEDVQHVLSRFAERGGGGCFAAEHGIRGALYLGGLNRWPVVGEGNDVQGNWARHGSGKRLRLTARAIHEGASLREADERRSITGSVLERIELPQRIETHGDLRRLAVGDQGPGELLAAEILRDSYGKSPPTSFREEMRGLALIRTNRIDVIVWADGDIELLFLIPIVVPEQDAEATIGVREPSLVRGRDALPGVVWRLDIDLLLGT